MTTHQHAPARVRNSAGFIIEDVDFEPVEIAPHMGCDGCVFEVIDDSGDCAAHACLQAQFPADHPLHGKRAVWVRKEASK